MTSQDENVAKELQQQIENEAACESINKAVWECADRKCKEKNAMNIRWCQKCKKIWCCCIWYVDFVNCCMF